MKVYKRTFLLPLLLRNTLSLITLQKGGKNKIKILSIRPGHGRFPLMCVFDLLPWEQTENDFGKKGYVEGRMCSYPKTRMVETMIETSGPLFFTYLRFMCLTV